MRNPGAPCYACSAMRKNKTSKARLKLHDLLKRYSQRELARLVDIQQPTICQLSTGVRASPRQSTRRKFETVGIDIEDWDNA